MSILVPGSLAVILSCLSCCAGILKQARLLKSSVAGTALMFWERRKLSASGSGASTC